MLALLEKGLKGAIQRGIFESKTCRFDFLVTRTQIRQNQYSALP
jgi:hypothetical protein